MLTVESSNPAREDALRLRAAVRALVRRFSVSERADVTCCGVTVAQAAALEALSAEGPVRLGDLGRRLGIAPSTLTRNLVRLESAGLVAREPDEKDARSARVGLTARGRRAAASVAAQEEGFARQVLERIPAERRARVVESLGELLGAVREATERCCPGAFDHLMEGFVEAGAGAGACGCGPSADDACDVTMVKLDERGKKQHAGARSGGSR
jgi:DNA-binding MarR family transcriptional regulator